jgi:surfeit locus 1 family protein
VNGSDTRRHIASDFVPPLAGLLLIGIFLMLGFWQVDRAAEKREIEESFEAEAGYKVLSPDATYDPYQPLTVMGRYLTDRQILLDNIVQDGRLGYYVLTPFEYDVSEPLLVVNRGWIAKPAGQGALPATGVGNDEISLRGRVGGLPRVGIRPGPPFDDAKTWPRLAVWPDLDDLARELDREVLPYILLADPDPGSALVRRWQPQQMGPMRHIGYAFQWFALALAVLVTGIVLYRRKRKAT